VEAEGVEESWERGPVGEVAREASPAGARTGASVVEEEVERDAPAVAEAGGPAVVPWTSAARCSLLVAP